MANIKISALADFAAPLRTDYLPLVDATAGSTKRAYIPALSASNVAVLVASSTATAKEKRTADYVCDGTSDDVQIQAAIDAVAGAGGGIVRLTAGLFNISPIVLKNLVWLVGAGMWATKLRLVNGANASMITNYVSSNGTEANAQFVAVRDMHLIGNKANQTGGHGIYFNQYPAWTAATDDADFDAHQLVENVMIENFKGHGLWGDDCRSSNQFRGIYTFRNDGNGIFPGPDTFISNCSSAWSGLAGYYLIAPNLYLVQCNAFYSGQIDPATGSGFYFSSLHHGTINLANCSAQDNGGAGYTIIECDSIAMTGCIADSNSTSGADAYPALDLWAATHCQITGFVAMDRMVSGTQKSALRMRDACSGNRIDFTNRAQYAGQVNANPLMSGSVSHSGSTLFCDNEAGQQALAYSSTITPNPYLGSTVVVGALTGNITIANPTNGHAGSRLTLLFTQDGTGTRTVTFGNAFKYVWTPSTTAGKKNSISFEYDGTNWVQLSSVVGM